MNLPHCLDSQWGKPTLEQVLYWFNVRSIVFFVVVILCITVSCTQQTTQNEELKELPYYNDATFTPHWIPKGQKPPVDFHRIPTFKLVNQEGDMVTEKTFDGKIYVTDFFFTTCPGICPKMTVNMSSLQDEFLNDTSVLLLSHSVTPKIDSVTTLKNYAIMNKIESDKWHLVTGDRSEIYQLGRKAYFVEEDLGLEKKADEFLHTENFVLIDKNGYIRGIYNGLNKTSVRQLIADVKTLKKEGVK